MRIGIITDTHFAPAGTPPSRWHNVIDFERADTLLDRAIEVLRECKVNQVAMLGDLTNFGDEESIRRAMGLLTTLEVPVLIVPGNHDCERDVEAFRSSVNEIGGGQVAIASGGSLVEGIQVVGLSDLTPDCDGGTLIIGAPASREWTEGAVVVLSHFPLLDRRIAVADAGLKYAGGFLDSGVRQALLERDAPAIVIHGHLHVRDAVVEKNVLQISCAALIEAPHAVSVIEVSAEVGEVGVIAEHHSVESFDARAVPILCPSEAQWFFAGGRWKETISGDL